jgi:hypothetical protein
MKQFQKLLHSEKIENSAVARIRDHPHKILCHAQGKLKSRLLQLLVYGDNTM